MKRMVYVVLKGDDDSGDYAVMEDAFLTLSKAKTAAEEWVRASEAADHDEGQMFPIHWYGNEISSEYYRATVQPVVVDFGKRPPKDM